MEDILTKAEIYTLKLYILSIMKRLFVCQYFESSDTLLSFDNLFDETKRGFYKAHLDQINQLVNNYNINELVDIIGYDNFIDKNIRDYPINYKLLIKIKLLYEENEN